MTNSNSTPATNWGLGIGDWRLVVSSHHPPLAQPKEEINNRQAPTSHARINGQRITDNRLPFARRWRPFLLLIGFLLLAACTASGKTWPRIQAEGVLRVGLDPTYPPFEVVDDQGLRGIDVDLAQALAADLGLETEFVYFGYDGLYDALITEQVDVLISALVIVPERTRDFAYSEPYFNAGEILILPADNTQVTGMEEMNGRSLAVELGSRGHVTATTWERRLADMSVRPYPTPDEALTAVRDGEADAALVDAVSGRLFLQDDPALKRSPEPVTVEPYALVVRKEDEILLAQLNASLERLRQSGKLSTILQRWLDG